MRRSLRRFESPWLLSRIPAGWRGLVLLGAAVLCRCLCAAENGYVQDAWTTREGLSQGDVAAIVQGSDGYLWLGTRNGLVRFDGRTFTVFDKNRTPALKASRIRALLARRDGTLWAGSDGGGVCRVERDTVRCLSLADGLSQEYVRALYESASGDLWVATGGGGLNRFAQGRFSVVGPRQSTAAAVVEDRDGRVWVIGNQGRLLRLEGNTPRPFSVADGLPSDSVSVLHLDSAGRLWAGTRDGLARYAGDRFTAVVQLSGQRISAIADRSDGGLWIGTWRGGLGVLQDGELRWIDQPGGAGKQDVLALHEDREGSLWIGAPDGLRRLRPKFFRQISHAEGLGDDHVRSVWPGRRPGVLWVTSEQGGLRMIERDRVTAVGGAELQGLSAGSLYEARDGAIYVATARGLGIIRGGRTTLLRESGGMSLAGISAIFEDDVSVLVALPFAGLRRWRNNRSEPFMPEAALGYVYSLYRDRGSVMWVAGEKGLGRIAGGEVRVYRTGDGLRHPTVHSVYEDGAGTIWLATRAGIARIRDGRIQMFGASEGLHEEMVFRILADAEGFFWLHTTSGVIRLRKSTLEDFLDGRVLNVPQTVFDASDGIAAHFVSSQSTASATPDGRMWFATQAGIAVLDPRALRLNFRAPAVRIEEVRLDGKPVEAGQRLDCPPRVGRVEIRFSALSLVAPHRVRYRYRLEGRDRDWSPPATASTVLYENLGPGEYRFRIMAANGTGVWNETGAVLPIRVAASFWQTPGFLFALAAAVLAGAAALYWVRVRQMQQRFSLISEERSRIARELHDTVEQALAGISLQLDTASAKLSGPPEATARSLNVARQMVRYAMTEARRSVWDLRPSELERFDLPTAIRETCSAAGQKNVSFRLEGSPRRLQPEVESHLLRFMQEAVSNALKHAEAARIDAILEFRPEQVVATVRDDGRGFDPSLVNSALSGHFGLLGMRERAHRLHGRLELDSNPGRGTECRLTVPA